MSATNERLTLDGTVDIFYTVMRESRAYGSMAHEVGGLEVIPLSFLVKSGVESLTASVGENVGGFRREEMRARPVGERG